MAETEARFWSRRASRLRLRVNGGIWLARVLPLWIASALVFSAILLWDRGRGGGLVEILAAAFGLFLLGSGAGHLVRRRRDYFDFSDALVFLDEKLGLYNRLSSAEAGVGEWPPIPSRSKKLFRWRVGTSWAPLAFSAILVALAALFPVKLEEPIAPIAPAPPSSWKEIERALEILREEVPIKEEALEEYRARLEGLKSKPDEEWFRHGSMEAGDSLREELASDMRELARSLSEVESSLEELLTSAGIASGSSRRLAERRLRAALDALEEVELALDPDSTRELQTLARAGKVRRATKEEIEKWKSIRERLYHGLPGGAEEILLARGRRGGAEGGEAAKGGVSRGPGPAPLDLTANPLDLGSTRIESVRGEDTGRDFSGATVGYAMGEHEVDTGGFRGNEKAGAVGTMGEGGDLVWMQSLVPGEKRLLQKYFK